MDMSDFTYKSYFNNNLLYITVSILSLISMCYGIFDNVYIAIYVGIFFMVIQFIMNYLIIIPLMTNIYPLTKIYKKWLLVYFFFTIATLDMTYLANTEPLTALATIFSCVYIATLALYIGSR